ncbi:MAG: phosphodiester glycosidase family protein [Armatimonadota bacterium]
MGLNYRRLLGFGALLALLAIAPALSQAAIEPVPIGPGTTYLEDYRPEGPWAIHIIEADLSQEYLELHTLLGGGEKMARRSLSGMLSAAQSETARAVAAVNGDFFSLGSANGLPLGLHIEDGELVTFPDPSRSVFYVLSDGTMHIDRLRANAWLRGPNGLLLQFSGMNHAPNYADMILFTPRFGDQTQADPGTLQIALVGLTDRVHPNVELQARVASISSGACQTIPPDGAVIAARGVSAYALRKLKVGDDLTLSLGLQPEKGQIEQAISGGPRLLRDGEVSVEYSQERFAQAFATRRHPRTALGIRAGTLVMVAVDGRQPGYSDGMTLYELAKLLLELNCTDAVNLDGGGSTTMVVRGSVANSPSGGTQRSIVNALAIVSVAPVGPPIQLSVEPREFSVLSGERISLRPTGLDQYYNPVAVDADAVQWEAAPMLGVVSKGGVFTGGSVKAPTMGLVMARLGNMSASSVAHVAPGPARIVVTPASITLRPGGTQQFTAQAYDEDNEPLSVSPGRVVWQLQPEGRGGRIGSSGVLTAPNRNGPVKVVARVGNVCGQADVTVGEEVALVETFEKQGGGWRYRAEPASLPGKVEWGADPLRAGNHGLRLRYDFTQGTGTRVAYADLNALLPETRAFSADVLGDGKGVWLRARLRDGAGRVFSVDLANKVNWSGSWRRLTAVLPDEAESPVTLESIYLAEIHDDHKPAGEMWLDDIATAEVPAAAAQARPAANAPVTGGK